MCKSGEFICCFIIFTTVLLIESRRNAKIKVCVCMSIYYDQLICILPVTSSKVSLKSSPLLDLDNSRFIDFCFIAIFAARLLHVTYL